MLLSPDDWAVFTRRVVVGLMTIPVWSSCLVKLVRYHADGIAYVARTFEPAHAERIVCAVTITRGKPGETRMGAHPWVVIGEIVGDETGRVHYRDHERCEKRRLLAAARAMARAVAGEIDLLGRLLG